MLSCVASVVLKSQGKKDGGVAGVIRLVKREEGRKDGSLLPYLCFCVKLGKWQEEKEGRQCVVVSCVALGVRPEGATIACSLP